MIIIRNTIALLTAATLMLTSCGSPETEKVAVDLADYAFETEIVEAQEPGCEGDDCTHVLLQIPEITGGDSLVVEKVNKDMEGAIRSIIKDRLPEPMAMGPWKALAESFIEGYTLFTMEFPDSPGKWFLEMTTDSSVFAENYFTLRIETTEYMGGAHPNYYTTLQTYNLESGEPVDILALFDKAALMREAEHRFRIAHDMSDSEPLNDEGMVFADGTFVLPENMGITPAGLTLIYNPYEVASYAEGQTVISIPLERIAKKPQV